MTREDVYLCREDGIVILLEIDHHDTSLVKSQLKLGNLNCNVDTAFTSLDWGLDRGDVLIAAGDMGSGGLYLVSCVVALPFISNYL